MNSARAYALGSYSEALRRAMDHFGDYKYDEIGSFQKCINSSNMHAAPSQVLTPMVMMMKTKLARKMVPMATRQVLHLTQMLVIWTLIQITCQTPSYCQHTCSSQAPFWIQSNC